MIRRYFAFTSPQAIAASRAFLGQRAEMKLQGKAIGDAFGGIPLFAYTVHGESFLGLRFVPPMDPQFWTKPDMATGVQRPRAGSTSRSAARSTLVELRARYEALKPTAVADLIPVYTACGTDWGNLLMHGVGYHCDETGVYLVTSLDLSGTGQEITGGAFEAARRGSHA